MPRFTFRRSMAITASLAITVFAGGVAAPAGAESVGSGLGRAVQDQPAQDRAVEFDPVDDPLAGDVTADDLWGPAAGDRLHNRVEVASDMVTAPVPQASQFAAQGVEFTGDPLGLAVYPLETRRYSLGTDRLGVYLCSGPQMNAGLNLASVTATLNGPVKQYFTQASGGAYTLNFVARKAITVTQADINRYSSEFRPEHYACADKVASAPGSTTDNGAYIVANNTSNGGLAGSGFYCPLPCSSSSAPNRFPANDRWGVIDGGSVGPQGQTSTPHLTTAIHELGHMIGWPHSNSGGFDEYDNAIDVMSANSPASLDPWDRADDGYASIAWNRYRAGWIQPNQVFVYRGGVRTVKIAPAGRSGTQMVVFPTGNKYAFATLDARRSIGYDQHLPTSFQGVTTHYIQQLGDCVFSGPSVCWGLNSGIFTYPPAPYSLRHVTKPGQSKRMNHPDGFRLLAHGAKVNVTGGDNSGYTVRIIGFSDTASSVFLDDIIWLAETGITKGCNDTGFCPTGSVTRGQMAAFLTRALKLPPGGNQGFKDIGGNTFAADINALARAGITKGCNPPANDRFCPDESVTRGQMAAFLVRAFDLPKGPAQGFTDTRSSVFRTDIDSLARVGITKGCNPPSNSKFCPTESVSRGQMAAFLKRGAPYLP